MPDHITRLALIPVAAVASLKGVGIVVDDTLTIATLLQVFEIVAILGGGGMVAFRVGKSTTKFEEGLKQQHTVLNAQSMEIKDLKAETKKLSTVLTTLAVQSNRLDRIEEDLREVKHGRGFVVKPPP